MARDTKKVARPPWTMASVRKLLAHGVFSEQALKARDSAYHWLINHFAQIEATGSRHTGEIVGILRRAVKNDDLRFKVKEDLKNHAVLYQRVYHKA